MKGHRSWELEGAAGVFTYSSWGGMKEEPNHLHPGSERLRPQPKVNFLLSCVRACADVDAL
jgi:hypothetical protein